MASGRVNRTYRPNTWLHRPSLRREDFSCQPGAVHTWHFSYLARCLCLVCYFSKGGHRPPSPFRSLSAPTDARCILSRWPRLLLENALHHACADAKFPADLEDPVTAGLQF